MRTATRRPGREEGQATVEFAIVIPLLLLLVFGIVQFGRAFNNWIDLNHLASEGARWAAVDKVPPYNGNLGNPAPNCAAMKQYLASQLDTSELEQKVSGGLPVDENTPNITLKVDGSGQGGSPQIGDAVTVTIKAPSYSIATIGFSFGDITLAGKATMRLEQIPSWFRTVDTC